jgi:predicted ATP-grasp superfamily ATP-dependent carboligase
LLLLLVAEGLALQILLYEYASGGGYAGRSLQPSVLCEGYAMLRALTADFKAAGHTVTSILDSRVAAFNAPLEADSSAQITSPDELKAAFSTAVDSAEATYIIAPETGGVLEEIVKKTERDGAASLNCNSAAIYSVANKPVLLEQVKRLGVQVPKSLRIHVHETTDTIAKSVDEELGFPAIFKPTNSMSCSGLTFVKDVKQIEQAVAKISAASSAETFLAQELIHGKATSVSVYSTGQEALPVSLNQQTVTLAEPDSESSYDGGAVPFDSKLKAKAFSAAKKLVESVQGLRGYVGVDIILTDDAPVVIEVNPRLTTSYVGLRMVSGFNPAEVLVDSVLNQRLPGDCETFGYACFEKVKTQKPTTTQLQNAFGLAGVFSPPFPIANDAEALALVTAHGEEPQAAKARLERNKRRLLRSLKGKGE